MPVVVSSSWAAYDAHPDHPARTLRCRRSQLPADDLVHVAMDGERNTGMVAACSRMLLVTVAEGRAGELEEERYAEHDVAGDRVQEKR